MKRIVCEPFKLSQCKSARKELFQVELQVGHKNIRINYYDGDNCDEVANRIAKVFQLDKQCIGYIKQSIEEHLKNMVSPISEFKIDQNDDYGVYSTNKKMIE